MRRTKFVVSWQRSGVDMTEPFEVGDGQSQSVVWAAALVFVKRIEDKGAKGVRLERHDPSPYHDRFDITTLYPEPDAP